MLAVGQTRLKQTEEMIASKEAVEAVEAVETVEAVKAVETVKAVEAVETVKAVEAVETVETGVSESPLSIHPGLVNQNAIIHSIYHFISYQIVTTMRLRAYPSTSVVRTNGASGLCGQQKIRGRASRHVAMATQARSVRDIIVYISSGGFKGKGSVEWAALISVSGRSTSGVTNTLTPHAPRLTLRSYHRRRRRLCVRCLSR